MDISKMEYDFLVKSVLGREITIDGELQTISESIIEACIAKADRDMLLNLNYGHIMQMHTVECACALGLVNHFVILDR